MNKRIRQVKVVVYLINNDQRLSKFLYSFKPKNILINNVVKLLTTGYGLSFLFFISILSTNNFPATLSIFLLIALLSTFFIEILFKKIVKRQRPGFTTHRLKTYSFPSTHASATALTIGHMLINYQLYNFNLIHLVLMFAWGVFVSLSRIIYGHHYMFDVLIGILLGSFLSIFFLLFNPLL